MNYIQVIFTPLQTLQSDILVALLADIGYEAFEEEELLLKACIKESGFDEAELKAIAEKNSVMYTFYAIAQQNWNATWERSFEPVIINSFAAIRAKFHQPVLQVQHEIIITPKMSFGTGHHATTYLMMKQMSHIDFHGKTVLDFGTGTGVLAILAEKMGAIEIIGIDNDDWSIDNAEENLIGNQSKNIQIQKAEELVSGKKYDIILANINLNVITANMSALAACCTENTIILLSGFLHTDEGLIKAGLESNNLKMESFTRQKDWICVLASS